MSAVFAILGVVGTSLYATYLLLRPKQKTLPGTETEVQQSFAEVKANATRCDVEFDSCEFRDSSYLSEVEQDSSDYRIAGNLVGSSIGGYYTPVERVETVQSVLFFKDEKLFEGKRFFQTFPIDITTLKFHVISGNVTLYVDKEDPGKYIFELTPP